jgi:hypothetical protein
MPDNIEIYQTRRWLKTGPDIFIGRGAVILLIVVTILFASAIWWLNHTPSLKYIWENFTVDKMAPAFFCEHLHLSNPVRQPVNTFSNIIYLLTAIIILKTTWNERYIIKSDDHLTDSKGYSLLFGFVLLYVFAASTFYHASLITLAHRLDYSAVFSFTFFPIMYLLNRWRLSRENILVNIDTRKSPVVFISAFLAVNLLLTFFTPKGKESQVAIILVILFLGMAIATVMFEKKNPGLKYLILSITSILIAVLWFELDKYKILCNPTGYFQPHSLWNIFIGVSAFCFYLYMCVKTNTGAPIVKMK